MNVFTFWMIFRGSCERKLTECELLMWQILLIDLVHLPTTETHFGKIVIPYREFRIKTKQVSTESKENAIRLFTQGYTKIRIAEILDCTHKTIHLNKKNPENRPQHYKNPNWKKNLIHPEVADMISAWVTFHGVQFISKTSEKVDFRQYSSILSTTLPDVSKSFCGDTYSFQHHNNTSI